MEKYKYPKFTVLFITIILAFFIFSGRDFSGLENILLAMGYTGVFLAGVLYAYSFTAAPATALLIILAPSHSIVGTGLIAGAGALLGDLLIFRFIRHSFQDEIDRFCAKKWYQFWQRWFPEQIKNKLVVALASLIIASPLPDEIGVSLLAAATNLPTEKFLVLSYALNTIGIFIILILANFA